MQLDENLLKTAYATRGGVEQVFSDKAADYSSARPGYPEGIYQFIQSACQLKPDALIADVGSGTGLFSIGWLKLGYQVVGIEPNASMRLAAETGLAAYPRFHTLDGSAEALPLDTASVDLICAAQAFHWFDVEPTRAEFLRVLKPSASVALIWNDRIAEDEFTQALNKLLDQFGGSKRQVLLAEEDQAKVERFFQPHGYQTYQQQHEQLLSEQELLSLVFSRSYMPARNSTQGQQASAAVGGLFARFSSGGRVAMRYRARVYLGRLG